MTIRIFGAIFGLVMLTACGQRIVVSKDCECGFYKSSDGKIMHWDDGAQVKFTFAKNFPEDLRPAVAAAGKSYNQFLKDTKIVIDPSSQKAPAISHNKVSSVSGDGANG